MLERVYEQAVQQAPALKEYGLTVARAIHKAFLAGGEPTRKIADLLHGTWLGHPLHAVLTDVTVGAWTCGTVFDVIGELTDDDAARQAGDLLAKAGVISAVPTALSGLTDYSTVPEPASSTATLHGVLNTAILGMYLVSLHDRKNGNRGRAVALAGSALGLALASAWLGGHLVYGHRVGPDNSQKDKGPEKWTPVLGAEELLEGKPKCVEAGDARVLLSRIDGKISAIGSVCSHATGPLEEGTFDGPYVQCPWHDSVFDLRDGKVKHGPATHPQPRFEVRVRKGQIEVRAEQG
jgi:nitrite reductase/ring-hydroxylating ferredoxin subunit/uncharacterized membrane protein